MTDLAAQAQYGYVIGQRGTLSAEAALALYGVNSPLESLRLQHQNADHGLIRLMRWDVPRNLGMGMARMKVLGGRWGATMTSDLWNICNHVEDAQAAGMTLHWVPPQRQEIYKISGNRRPFLDPAPCVREACLLMPAARHVFFQRIGYDLPNYGNINPAAHFKTSQITHFGMVIRENREHLRFYDEILGLLRARDGGEAATHNQVGPGNIFDLRVGEGYFSTDFDDPRSSATDFIKARSGRLKIIRMIGDLPIDNVRDLSRPGSLGYCAYTYRVDNIADYQMRVAAGGASKVTTPVPNEFGEPSISFDAPDGYAWNLLQ